MKEDNLANSKLVWCWLSVSKQKLKAWALVLGEAVTAGKDKSEIWICCEECPRAALIIMEVPVGIGGIGVAL